MGGMMGMMGGPAAMLNRNAFTEAVATLGELNLSPDFTLAKEQKERVQAVRDDYKKQTDKWRTDHEADIKKIQDNMAAMRGGGGGGGAAGGGGNVRQAIQDLTKTMPDFDAFVKQLKEALAADQVKRLEDKLAERKAEQEKQMQDMRQRFGGGGGAAGGGGGGRRNRGGGGGAARATDRRRRAVLLFK